MNSEILEVLDSEGDKTGRVMDREKVHEKELPHPVAYIWIYNSREEILMQKRSENKEIRPLHWGASAAGHIRANKDPKKEAIREVKEELGVDVREKDLEILGVYRNYVPKLDGKLDKEFAYTFLWEYSGEVSDFTPDEYEVSQVRFFSLEELYKEVNSENSKREYTPYGEYYNIVIETIEERLK